MTGIALSSNFWGWGYITEFRAAKFHKIQSQGSFGDFIDENMPIVPVVYKKFAMQFAPPVELIPGPLAARWNF
jgi:hypothetical protein